MMGNFPRISLSALLFVLRVLLPAPRSLLLALTAWLFALCSSTSAQQTKQVSHIGYLSNQNAAGESSRSEAIRMALRDLGYVEGKNISIEYRYTDGKRDRAAELVAELVRLKVDVIIVAGGASWILAAKAATKTIPIVMTGAGADPVKEGFIESLSRPGGNITGITSLIRELAGKRLELLKEAVPKVADVAALYDPSIPGTTREVKEDLLVAARTLALTVRSWDVRGEDGLERVLAALTRGRPDGLYVAGGFGLLQSARGQMFDSRKRIVSLALKSRLPSMYNSRAPVEAGGLMSYGADLADSYRRVAYYVDRILKGTKPADLPVEQPTKFQFVINLKTAKQIGLTIPPNVLARADKVIR